MYTKLNILILSDDYPPKSFGGAGIIAYNDARALVKKGHSVTVVTTTQKQGEEGVRDDEGVKIYTLYSSYRGRWRHYISLYNPRVLKRLKKIIQEIEPEIVHAHNIHLHISYAALSYARSVTSKVFLTAHDVMSVHYGKFVVPPSGNLVVSPLKLMHDFKLDYNPLRNIIIRNYFKKLKRIFAVSNAVKKILNANGIENVETLYNGIDVEDWKISDDEVVQFKKKHNLMNEKIVLLCGRINGLKGGDAALNAFRKVYASYPNARLVVVGASADYIRNLENRYEDISKALVVVDWIPRGDMKLVYGMADVVIVPSIYEDPFPTVNLEAMAMRKPVVGTVFGGTQEIVKNGVTGYIVDPHDESFFAERIIDLLNNPHKAQSFGNEGYAKVEKDFSLEAHLEKLLVWYTSEQ